MKLRLVPPRQGALWVRQGFKVTRLDTVFRFYDTREEAVAAIP